MTERLARVLREISIGDLCQIPYPLAYWRMPGSSARNLLLSTSSATQISADLENLPPGFLFNEFDACHPPKPLFISGDVLMTDSSVLINPKVSSTAIDFLLESLENQVSAPEEPFISQSTPPVDFTELVSRAVEAIKSGQLEKVVIARYEDTILPSEFSLSEFFDRVCENYPHAFCSLVHVPGAGIWIGASPELLISSNEHSFRTISLAGTKPIDDLPLPHISWTQKEIEEQAFVSRYIINCFKKIRLREFEEHGPKTVQAGNLAHLRTDYLVDVGKLSFDNLTSQMLELLHPTAAVCGMPLQEARQFIQQNEGFDRAYYAGFLGPVNVANSTDLFVNLRCMRILDGRIRFYAGAGITEDSIPEKELEETNLKISVLKRLI